MGTVVQAGAGQGNCKCQALHAHNHLVERGAQACACMLPSLACQSPTPSARFRLHLTWHPALFHPAAPRRLWRERAPRVHRHGLPPGPLRLHEPRHQVAHRAAPRIHRTTRAWGGWKHCCCCPTALAGMRSRCCPTLLPLLEALLLLLLPCPACDSTALCLQVREDEAADFSDSETEEEEAEGAETEDEDGPKGGGKGGKGGKGGGSGSAAGTGADGDSEATVSEATASLDSDSATEDEGTSSKRKRKR